MVNDTRHYNRTFMRLKTTIFILFLAVCFCTIAQNTRIKKRFCNKDRIEFPVYYKDTIKDNPKDAVSLYISHKKGVYRCQIDTAYSKNDTLFIALEYKEHIEKQRNATFTTKYGIRARCIKFVIKHSGEQYKTYIISVDDRSIALKP